MTLSAGIWHPVPRSVAVFRALNLGDLLCAIPAFRALRRALPEARITLIGLQSAIPVAARFKAYIDELILFPGDPAFPEQAARLAELPDFYRRMQARNFDLVLQMHGSGAQSNTIVQAMGGRCWAGFVPDAQYEQAGRLMAWPDHLPEIHRYLALLSYLGATADDATLEFPLTDDDHDEADAVAVSANIVLDQTVFVHPGARLASRRWPLDRFAHVATSLAAQGWQIAVTGSSAESELAETLVRQLAFPVANLCGKTSLGGLVSMLRRGRLLVCNDTGISHLAAAARLPSVVIASGSDVSRWAPLDADLHHVLYTPVPCRPCSYPECPIGHPCAKGVSVSHVLEQSLFQLAQASAH